MSEADQQNLQKMPRRYEVGYGRPPVEHRFRKGRSGNPGGRPKGSTNKPKIDDGFGMRAAEEYLRLEAYRTVKVREGDELIELPAIQAVFRAMGVSAMKGNRFAQKTMAELVTGLEQRDAESRFELFGSALEYKQRWEEQIERSCKAGIEIPDPVPHPADIILDPSNGDVRIDGPQTTEQKQYYDQARERRIEAQENVSYFAEKHRRAKRPDLKSQYLDEWHFEQRMFDIINDAMRGRHKMRLKDRSSHAEASREGEALKAFAEDRRKPQDEREWGDFVE